MWATYKTIGRILTKGRVRAIYFYKHWDCERICFRDRFYLNYRLSTLHHQHNSIANFKSVFQQKAEKWTLANTFGNSDKEIGGGRQMGFIAQTFASSAALCDGNDPVAAKFTSIEGSIFYSSYREELLYFNHVRAVLRTNSWDSKYRQQRIIGETPYMASGKKKMAVAYNVSSYAYP